MLTFPFFCGNIIQIIYPKAVQQTANQLQSKIDDVKESVGLYSEILGMRLEAIADKSLCCAFRCINNRMPTEEYKVVIASVDKLFSGK